MELCAFTFILGRERRGGGRGEREGEGSEERGREGGRRGEGERGKEKMKYSVTGMQY